jgi:hypothetical protein
VAAYIGKMFFTDGFPRFDQKMFFRVAAYIGKMFFTDGFPRFDRKMFFRVAAYIGKMFFADGFSRLASCGVYVLNRWGRRSFPRLLLLIESLNTERKGRKLSLTRDRDEVLSRG